MKSAGEAATAQDGRLTALEQSVSSAFRQGRGAQDSRRSRSPLRVGFEVGARTRRAVRGRTRYVCAISPNAPEIATLRTYAEKGVPTRTEIASQMDAAANAMVAAATPVDENAGLLQNLLSSAESLVKVRPIGAVEGARRAGNRRAHRGCGHQGDYAKALSEYDTLPQAAKAAGADFAGKLKARIEVETQVDALISGAMRHEGNTMIRLLAFLIVVFALGTGFCLAGHGRATWSSPSMAINTRSA